MALGKAQTTRERLILAAERLIAEVGLHVSLREIAVAAGQRNTAAVRYHIGDRADLIAAVTDYRMTEVNERRLAMLANMHAQGRASDIESRVEALLIPLAQSIDDPQSYYLRFLAKLFSDPLKQTELDRTPATSLSVVMDSFRRDMTDLPADVVELRIRMLFGLMIHSLAQVEAAQATKRDRASARVALDTLKSACLSLIIAPQLPTGTPESARTSSAGI